MNGRFEAVLDDQLRELFSSLSHLWLTSILVFRGLIVMFVCAIFPIITKSHHHITTKINQRLHKNRAVSSNDTWLNCCFLCNTFCYIACISVFFFSGFLYSGDGNNFTQPMHIKRFDVFLIQLRSYIYLV